jgi:hypothetical protein
MAIAVAGAGLGLVLGPASTDALNRAPGVAYGEVTGITQTVRNFGASLGLKVMGSRRSRLRRRRPLHPEGRLDHGRGVRRSEVSTRTWSRRRD